MADPARITSPFPVADTGWSSYLVIDAWRAL
jgi:hypothetical protein